MGDALYTSHYHTGNGAGVALLTAHEWGGFLESAQSLVDLQRYQFNVEDMLHENRKLVRRYLLDRRLREEDPEAHRRNNSLRFEGGSNLRDIRITPHSIFQPIHQMDYKQTINQNYQPKLSTKTTLLK